jgi:hypothetical protein
MEEVVLGPVDVSIPDVSVLELVALPPDDVVASPVLASSPPQPIATTSVATSLRMRIHPSLTLS